MVHVAGRVEGYRCSAGWSSPAPQPGEPGPGQSTAPAVSPLGTTDVGLTVVACRPCRRMAAPGRSRPDRPACGSLLALIGTVYVANSRGQLLAFASERRDLLLARGSGASAGASPVVDATHVYVAAGRTLVAVSRATGLVAWTVDLGGSTDDRSEPLIGADRTLYVTRADQELVAVRESGWRPHPPTCAWTPPRRGPPCGGDNSSEETGFRAKLELGGPLRGCRDHGPRGNAPRPPPVIGRHRRALPGPGAGLGSKAGRGLGGLRPAGRGGPGQSLLVSEYLCAVLAVRRSFPPRPRR